MEVMGLMLGQFVDDYTITCVDVFAMPQVTSNIFSQRLLNITASLFVCAVKLPSLTVILRDFLIAWNWSQCGGC